MGDYANRRARSSGGPSAPRAAELAPGKRTLVEAEAVRVAHGGGALLPAALHGTSPAVMRGVGKETLTAALPVPTQSKAAASPAQARRAGTAAPSTDAAGVFAGATSGPGQPVPFRDEMERAFGEDFSSVKAHLGQREAMSRIGAQAATQGDSIAFATSNPDRTLVAHELAHVVQGREGRIGLSAPAASHGVSNPSDSLEREAEATAAQVAAGGTAPGAAARASAIAEAPVHRPAVSSGGIIHRYNRQELARFEERYQALVARMKALETALERVDNLETDGNEEAKAGLDELLHDIEGLRNAIQDNYNENDPGDGDGSETRDKLYELRTQVETDILSPRNTDAEDIAKAGLKIHLEKLAQDQIADEDLDDSLSTKDSPKARAARKAREIQGGLSWISGADHKGGNHFRQWLQSDDDDIPAPGEDALPTMNCWEGVFYAAFKAGVTTKAALQEIYGDPDRISAAVSKAIGDRRSLRELRTAGQAPEVGDVIVFNQVSDHVAISLGGDRVMSLWNQPGPEPVMAETSLSALAPHTGSDSLDNILVAKNCTLFQAPG